jgi:sulfur carrier protein ThiS
VKVRVRLYGALRTLLPAGDRHQGRELEVPDGFTVDQLLTELGVGASRGAIVVAGGRILQGGDLVEDGASLAVFQQVSGG